MPSNTVHSGMQYQALRTLDIGSLACVEAVTTQAVKEADTFKPC